MYGGNNIGGGGGRQNNNNNNNNNIDETNLKIARNRFKNVLKHIVQDNLMHDEEVDTDVYTGYGLSRNGKAEDQPPKPPPAFLMKLFDRGVDLAQFDDKTPLYPICRAWIHNKPQQKKTAKNSDNPDELGLGSAGLDEYGIGAAGGGGESSGSGAVYKLPPPEPLPYDEYGNQFSLRVPPPLPRADEPFDINYADEDAPSPALLFQNHLDRWNVVRQRWKEASAYNERRYHASFKILNELHETVKPEDPNATNPMDELESIFQQQIDEQHQQQQEYQDVDEQEEAREMLGEEQELEDEEEEEEDDEGQQEEVEAGEGVEQDMADMMQED